MWRSSLYAIRRLRGPAVRMESKVWEGSSWLALGGSRAVTVRPGPRAFRQMLLGLVTPRGAVLSSVHPYPRVCKFLRRLAFPWRRRFESSGLRAIYA
jgi:hypothetical protein